MTAIIKGKTPLRQMAWETLNLILLAACLLRITIVQFSILPGRNFKQSLFLCVFLYVFMCVWSFFRQIFQKKLCLMTWSLNRFTRYIEININLAKLSLHPKCFGKNMSKKNSEERKRQIVLTYFFFYLFASANSFKKIFFYSFASARLIGV